MLLPHDAALAARDRALPGLALLLDPAALTAALVDDGLIAQPTTATLTYLRYKPGTSCLAGYRLLVDDEPLDVTAIAYADAGAALAKTRSLREADDPPTRWWPDHRIAVALFPADRRLSSLAQLTTPATRQALLRQCLPEWPDLWSSHLERLVYKPERRYVGRLMRDGQPLAVLRAYSESGYAGGLIGAASFHSEGDLRIARPLGRARRQRLLITEWLPGVLLWERLADPTFPLSLVARVGAALARLHRQPVTSLRLITRQAELDSLVAVAVMVAHLLPERTGWLQRLVSGLGTRVLALPDASSPLHGDFYSRQVVLDGDQIGLLDLDEAALGDPVNDLGNFVAHLERDVLRGWLAGDRRDLVRQALIDGYASVRPVPTPDRLALATAVSLLRLAPHPFRHRVDDWPEQTAAILDRVAVLATAAPPPRLQPSAATLSAEREALP